MLADRSKTTITSAALSSLTIYCLRWLIMLFASWRWCSPVDEFPLVDSLKNEQIIKVNRKSSQAFASMWKSSASIPECRHCYAAHECLGGSNAFIRSSEICPSERFNETTKQRRGLISRIPRHSSRKYFLVNVSKPTARRCRLKFIVVTLDQLPLHVADRNRPANDFILHYPARAWKLRAHCSRSFILHEARGAGQSSQNIIIR